MSHISEKLKAEAEPRLRRVAEMTRAGESQLEISRKLGLSQQRVSQLVKKARDRKLLG